MRKWLATSVCALFAVIAVGCGGGDSDNSTTGQGTASTEPITLTVWDFGVPDPRVTRKIDDAYMAEHPNVTIRRVHQPSDTDTYQTLLRSAMAARKGPDIFYTFAGRYVLDFLNGTRELDDLMAPGDEEMYKGWADSAALAPGGKHYMVPVNGNGSILYYNRALFKQAGLDPDVPPVTWDEFLTACDKLKAAGIVPLSGGFKDGGMGELMAGANWSLQYMTDEESAEAVAHPDWSNPGIGKAFALLKQLNDRGCFTPNAEAINFFPDAVNNLKAGKAAMGLGLVAADAHWSAFRDTKWGRRNLGTMRFPLVPDSNWDEPRVQFTPADALAITKWTKDPQAAYDFIKFYSNPANQELLFKEAGSFPGNVRANPQSSDPIAQQLTDWVLKEPTVGGGPIGAIGANVETALLRFVPQIVSGEVTYDEIADQLVGEQEKAEAEADK